MQIDYIRRNTPESFSEDGGAYIQIVNKKTTGLTASIEEARATLHVVGSAQLIESYFVGIMRSVFEGIREDGHPRTVGDISFYPVCGGQFDLDKGWDPAVNDVRIKARLLNGVTLDITDWTFRDVTEGRVAFTVDTVSDGAVEGRLSTQSNLELNCRNLPAKEMLSVGWVCGSKNVPVAPDKYTTNVARVTIDKSAFSTLTAEDDGKEIAVTVKGCYNKQTKTATVKYVPPTPIYTSTLGGTHIYAGVTTAGDKLPTDDIHVTSADDVLVLTGDAKPTNPENPTTGIVSAYLTGCGEENLPLTPVYDTAAGTMTLKLGLAMFQLDPGTYENAKIKLVCYKDGQQDGLEIAKKVIKSE